MRENLCDQKLGLLLFKKKHVYIEFERERKGEGERRNLKLKIGKRKKYNDYFLIACH